MQMIMPTAIDARSTTCESVVKEIVPRGCGFEDDAPSVVLLATNLLPESLQRSGDSGSINSVRVTSVYRCRDGQLHHRLHPDALCPSPGQRVVVRVDAVRRQRIEWVVCTGRLIERLAGEGMDGLAVVETHLCVDAARVEFGAPELLPEPQDFARWLDRRIQNAIANDLPVRTQFAELGNYRRVQIGDGPQFSCDGPYPASIGLLGKVSIGPVFVRGGRLIVRYSEPA